MIAKSKKQVSAARRQFTGDFKREAVQMLLDGHSASSVVERLGLSGTNLLSRWKREQLEQSGPVASALDARVLQLEAELRRVERERDILKKALAILRTTLRTPELHYAPELRAIHLNSSVVNHEISILSMSLTG